jgi:predicted lactoylglutathione lyase
MAADHSRKLFLNLPVRDLKKSMEFFSKLGFEFNPKFTDNNAACMIISEEAYAMLLAEPFFALSCESRTEVDELMKKAVAAGAKHAAEPQDHGFMYGRSFYDLDGHHWEIFWMDPKAAK